MYKGIDPRKPLSYRLRKDTDNPTIWWLYPQSVAVGNKHIAGYQDAQTKKTLDSVASKTTLQDLNQFLTTVAYIENYTHRDGTYIETTEDRDVLKKIFYELDIASFNELMNASRDVFELSETEKNGSGSLSGQPLSDENPEGSDMIVATAASKQGGPGGTV